MTSWHRRLRLGLGIFIVVLAVVLAVSLRRSPQRSTPKPPPTRTDPDAVLESTSGRSLRFLGARQDIVIDHYDWMGQYPDGRTRVTGGVFRILQRGGRDFVIKSREAETRGQQPNIDVALKGSVEVTSSDGLFLRTEEATYSDGEGVVRAPGPVAFTRNRMSGTAVGMTYDKTRDVLWLLDQVVIHNQPDERGQDGTDIRAGAAGFARADKYVRFERGVTLERGGQTIQADGGVAYLTPDERRVQMLELRGSSRVSGAPTADGGLKGMSSRDMNLTYAEDGRTLQRALLSGEAAVDLAGGRRLEGQFIDVGLGPDGTTVTALVARDRVVLELPAEKTTPARRITSGSLQGSGTPKAGLTEASFSETVEFRETPAPPAKPRVARSAALSLALKNGFDSIESARFAGGVQFEEGTMTASARDARYNIAGGTLTMAGVDEKTGRQPQMVDEQATIEGKLLTIVLDGQQITATDAVKTEMRPATDRQGTEGAALRRGALIKQDKPVYAVADRLVYDGGTSHADYTGNAQLWQGDMRIKADRILVDDESGNLTATGSVDSRLVLDQVNQKSKAKETTKSVATAKDMVYDDSVRRATYTGTARLIGPDGDLAADKIEIYLQENGSEMDRLEAYTGVTLRTPDGRRASGVRLTYLAATEQYDMAGAPVKLEDESGQTTGNSLTFFRSADRIVVDGKEQRRTELKRGIKR
jgi:LPS export ABC transporter protein LptC/lipopolysaccharide transport protein LptA